MSGCCSAFPPRRPWIRTGRYLQTNSKPPLRPESCPQPKEPCANEPEISPTSAETCWARTLRPRSSTSGRIAMSQRPDPPRRSNHSHGWLGRGTISHVASHPVGRDRPGRSARRDLEDARCRDNIGPSVESWPDNLGPPAPQENRTRTDPRRQSAGVQESRTGPGRSHISDEAASGGRSRSCGGTFEAGCGGSVRGIQGGHPVGPRRNSGITRPAPPFPVEALEWRLDNSPRTPRTRRRDHGSPW